MCCALVEQGRHERMSDKYKSRYIIIVPPFLLWSRSSIGGCRGYNDSVPGVAIEAAPSVDRTAWCFTWSASLPRVYLISPGGWSNMSPGRANFVPSPPKTGTNLRHPRPPQSLNDSVGESMRRHSGSHRTKMRKESQADERASQIRIMTTLRIL